ncbi:mRNA 3' end processing factor [Recurvomyces mirabilis]|nr:mRNA 3' end processing factor [Recurvomyces mirabilis]
MSARSPRSSLSGSSDVALDFAESLKDLQQNNKWEISNLTTIARESTEHAQAISKALEDHINTAAPSKKLVALYVLDSIVKNVGTPYTVYLGSNLSSTFFNAYRLVDPQTRRAMESLFRTWKEPIPGALDRQPVFTHKQTSTIENALNQIKAMDVKRQAPMQTQYGQRQVATPPQFNGQFAMPQIPPQHQQPAQYYAQQPAPQQSWPPAYPPPTPQHVPVAQPPPYVDVNSLNADIASLISRIQARLAANHGDQGLYTQLQALQQLQQLMNTGAVTGQALQDVRNKVSGLATAVPPSVASTPQPHALAPQWPPAQPTPQPFQMPLPVPQPYQPPQQVSLPFMQSQSTAAQQAPPALFPPGALNGLQALLANGNKPSTPQMRVAAPMLQNASHNQLSNVQNNMAAAPPNNPTDLLAALSKSGVLSSLVPPRATPSTQPLVVSAPPPQSTASLLQSLSSIFPPLQKGTPTLPPAQIAGHGRPRIPMVTAELKVFRPELVRALYDDQPNQCSTCGRRFLATEEGRAKKQRHLDWHFRTNQRMADPAISRGQHRRWFVDEVEWITLPEFDPSTASATDTANGAAAQKKKQKGPKDQFIRAPAGVTRFTCSICQEEMKSSYSDELQDWVFMNATYYNGKPAHATCVEEMKRPFGGAGGSGGGALAAALSGGAGQRQRSATPESALGKRKAESILAGHGSKVRNG